ncbi:hypothetical protein H0H87_009958 [Tephrocybe sp. NHM501043]|nr:hypothetical protein H0H87_009958 [Tephrocybe sp. NHM501043]
MQLGAAWSVIYIADFGLAIPYQDASSSHIPLQHVSSMIGTLQYLSINGHKGLQLSQCDDLKSMAYVLFYLFNGLLPWQGVAKNSHKKSALILKKKLKFIDSISCTQPPMLATLLTYAHNLAFDADPNYDYLKSLFLDALNQLETACNNNNASKPAIYALLRAQT